MSSSSMIQNTKTTGRPDRGPRPAEPATKCSNIMEESGHYYTVYFTSLSVGFAEDVAYQQAVMAQMPDEVGWLDAANLHTDECLGFKEFDLNSNKLKVPNEWRYLVEYALHSLPDKRTANTSS